MEVLLFRLYGPLVAWGDIAIGERRPVQSWPTKSAVLGLVAGALGVRRDASAEHQRLSDGLGFACRQDAIGALLEDFHTAEVPKGPSLRKYARRQGRPCATRREELAAMRGSDNPSLSFRQYRADAVAIGCLWRRAESAPRLEELEQALRRPVFVPYLGRKSCVTALPFAPRVVSAENPVQALRLAEFGDAEFLERLLHGPRQVTLHWEGEWDGEIPLKTLRRRDVPFDRVRRQFRERSEHFAVYTVGASESE